MTEATRTPSRRSEAADHYRAALTAGNPPSGAELGRQFDRSPQWGRALAAEVRQSMNGHRHNGASNANGAAPVASSAPPEPPPIEMAPASDPPHTDTAPASAAPRWVAPATVAAVLAVALAAAVASTDHLAAVARLAGTTGWRAWLLPVAVDGLAVAASLTLYRAHRLGQAVGTLPWVALLAGLATSVAGNVVSVYPELVEVGTLKVCVGATPPLALAAAVELALRQTREA